MGYSICKFGDLHKQGLWSLEYIINLHLILDHLGVGDAYLLFITRIRDVPYLRRILFALTLTWRASINLESYLYTCVNLLLLRSLYQPLGVILRLALALGNFLDLTPTFRDLGWSSLSLGIFPRTCYKLVISLHLFLVDIYDIGSHIALRIWMNVPLFVLCYYHSLYMGMYMDQSSLELYLCYIINLNLCPNLIIFIY